MLGATHAKPAERLVPHVVADHEHIGRTGVYGVEQFQGVGEHLGVYLIGSQVAVHYGLHVADT